MKIVFVISLAHVNRSFNLSLYEKCKILARMTQGELSIVYPLRLAGFVKLLLFGLNSLVCCCLCDETLVLPNIGAA
jgi:hypothetical protein